MSIPYFTNHGLYRICEVFFPNQNSPSTFKLALCAKHNEKSVDNAPAVDKGSGRVGIPVTAHGYSAGDIVRFTGTINYSGSLFILDNTTTTNELVITTTYAAESFTGSEKVHLAPGRDVNTLSELTEIAAGNGYVAGGADVPRNLTSGFDTLTEDDANDLAKIQLQDITWTASGGTIPASGDGIRYAVLLDDSSGVICFWDFGNDSSVSAGQQFIAKDAEIVLTASIT